MLILFSYIKLLDKALLTNIANKAFLLLSGRNNLRVELLELHAKYFIFFLGNLITCNIILSYRECC